jgi:peptidyl-prolyl cis-trans isomerase A (cyclophilin A)
LTIDVREGWAPLGSEQFLTLVDKEFFTDLPFFRVCPRYITQFGAKYGGNRVDDLKVIKDDPTLWGKRDMDFGYVFFAGSGPNSRYNEMVFALCMMKGCKVSGLGNAPWEVPVGTIRKEAFPVLQDIAASGFPYPRLEMPGQTPKAGGPDRHKLETDKNYLKEKYPYMEYFQGCKVLSRNQHISRPLSIDHPDTDMTVNIVNMNKALDANNQAVAPSIAVHDLASSSSENSYFVKFTIATSQGEGVVIFQIFPQWAPLGAPRFRTLVENHYFDGTKFFRVIKNFMAQFGMNGDPLLNNKWNKDHIQDDPFIMTNGRGTITFATSGPNSRSTQLFINLVDNKYLDKDFEPIGKVIVGMQVVDQIYSGYGEGGSGDGTDGRGPSQGRIAREGNAYLDRFFPKLSTIISAQIIDKVTES